MHGCRLCVLSQSLQLLIIMALSIVLLLFLYLISVSIDILIPITIATHCLLIGFLPNIWRKLTPDTQKPLSSWLKHFLLRHSQYESWIKSGEPAVMWLSGLHIPESYLTALVQTTCRKRGWPLDKSTLYTIVTKYTNYNMNKLENLESGSFTADYL